MLKVKQKKGFVQELSVRLGRVHLFYLNCLKSEVGLDLFSRDVTDFFKEDSCSSYDDLLWICEKMFVNSRYSSESPDIFILNKLKFLLLESLHYFPAEPKTGFLLGQLYFKLNDLRQAEQYLVSSFISHQKKKGAHKSLSDLCVFHVHKSLTALYERLGEKNAAKEHRQLTYSDWDFFSEDWEKEVFLK